MPIGPFGEIIGTTGTLDCLGEAAANYKTKVVAPRNPKLIKGEKPVFKMRPSQFMFQVNMNTEQKLANMHTMSVPKKLELLDMSETTHQKHSKINIDEPMFQPFPSEVVFQNYEPFETYEVPLVLRNNDKVPRLVKVVQEESPYFKIISPHNVGHKVGPGLPTTFVIQFVPEEKKDYYHELTCITEREKFIVPVRAIGARAILDFPDDVHFKECPVKYSSSRTLLVRNIGNKEAKFSLSAEKPFIVTPENGTLPVNESMQVTIEFSPTTCGERNKDLLLHYDTGEDICIQLYGVSLDANVRLDKNSTRIENTYLSMANQRTVTITNRSNVIASFRWTQYATQEEEDQHKLLSIEGLKSEERTEKDRFLEECIQDPSLRDKMSVLTRTYHNKSKLVEEDKMLFNDDVVKIEPCEGEIWPNSSMEVSVIFKPEEPKIYNRTAFCDITGRESRLPLRIRGDGIGPNVQFSFDSLDMGNIFVNSTHTYEVVLANKGDIDAIFSLILNNSVFGPCFNFNPSEGIVMPEGHQAIQITFSSTVLGDLNEDFYFQIDGAPERLKLTFTGTVIGPTFHFDVPKLKFGTVSFGFTSSQTCTLINTALVPMKYSLRVPGDGTGEGSISSTHEFDSTNSDAGSTAPPREFTITPSEGKLPPQSECKVQVDLCSNTVKKYDLALVVDVEGVGECICSLPIIARCIVPQITVVTPILDYGRCFLRHPYEHHVKLQNESELPAKYELLPQQVDEDTCILYTSPHTKGIIEPHSVMDVPIVISSQSLEELETTAFFVIFGCPEAPLPVSLNCVGEGPVVHVMPLDMDWQQIPVLSDTPKIVRLSNESLIPAKFSAHMVRPNSVWRVEPSSGEIPPEEQLELTITACLTDCVRFVDKLQINFLDGPARTIPVTAYGFGTTIVADPPMTPALNLGPNFSKAMCRRSFTLTNKGRRHQSLVWSTEGFALTSKPKRHNGLQPINPKDMKFRDNPPPPEPPKPIFSLTPQRLELNPGESVDVLLEGYVDSPQIVKERLLCHAIIGRAGGKELITKVAVNCEFIAPLLEFSSDNVFFRVDKNPEDELCIREKDLQVTNISSLPLTAQLSLQYPFQLLDDNGTPCSSMELSLGIGEDKKITINFDPEYKSDKHIRIIDEVLKVTYQQHPHVDEIPLRGEVYFPNLEFEKHEINFGCILNDTEVTRYVNITNSSPMDVKYKWSFLIDDEPIAVFHPRPQPVIRELTMSEEGGHSPHSVPDMSKVLVHGAASPIPDNTFMQDDSDLMKEDMLAHEASRGGEEPVSGESDGEEKKDKEKPVTVEQPEKTEEGLNDQEVQTAAIPGEGAGSDNGEEPLDAVLRAQQESVPPPRGNNPLPTPTPQPAINPVLAQILQDDRERFQLGVEEIFDILPLYGTLKPGDTEQITLTFYGHADIGSKAKAICEVIGGPTYEIVLKGEASLVNYAIDCLDIDYGKIMYDQVSEAEITVTNTGKVGFEFCGLGMDPQMASKPQPGIPIMIPHTGFIEPGDQQTLIVRFLPGAPSRFNKSFQLQIAHFEPDNINLFGEGVFPRISLDLPRVGDIGGFYDNYLKEAKESLAKETKKNQRPMSGVSTQRDCHHTGPCTCHESMQASELELQMEVERMVVQEFAQELQQENRQADVLAVHDQSRQTSKRSKKKSRQRARLPDYLLDFGHVVLGTVRTHVVRATNTGWFPCSFIVDHENLHTYGFSVELDRVRQLPGAPDHETVDFVVSFDPRGANLSLGEVTTVVPINIVGGPQVCIQLRANVTMPDMQISTDVLEFNEVKCGECKVVTVQIYNHKHVRCEWNSLPTDNEKKKELEKLSQADKHVPMHLRRKQKPEKAKPRHFEMMPPTGVLMPGQRQNVQVKFMPTEEKNYEQRIVIRLAQSSQRILLLCKGQGHEPHIELERNLVEFGPILPHSVGDEQEIRVRNPGKFPVEIYSLEYDKTYLEEEKILRLMKGYDEFNTILLPPRPPGDKLPQELLDYYEEQMKKLEEQERVRREAEEAEARRAAEMAAAQANEGADGTTEKADADDTQKSDQHTTAVVPTLAVPSRVSQDIDDDRKTEKSQTEENKEEQEEGKLGDGASTIAVGELEITPVSAAIARHLGIDLSSEGKAARNRRGIAVMVHGAPSSGKTTLSVQLAKFYGAALLTLDGIVLEAISNGNTPAGIKARELCSEAAHRKAEEMRAQQGETVEAAPADPKKTAGGLSVEAVTAHTAGTASGETAAKAAPSTVSNRNKASTVSDQKSKADKSMAGSRTVAASSGEGGSQDMGTARSETNTDASHKVKPQKREKHEKADKHGTLSEQVPSSPPPLAAPIARRLSISASVAGEEGLLSCVLPEELLVDILSDRLMLNDCQRGVVFDGLETLFAQNQLQACRTILKALNNRKYMFMVTLKHDYNTLKEQEKAAEEERERQALAAEEAERMRLEEMSEDEYDALDDQSKAEMDRKRLDIKKERLKKEMEERLERERIEREEREAALRRQEEEKLAKKKKGAKGGATAESKDKKNAATGKADEKKPDRSGTLTSQGGKRHGEEGGEHKLDKSKSGGERPESHQTDRVDSSLDDKKKKKEGKRSAEGAKGKKKGQSEPDMEEEPQEELPKLSEEELLLLQRFKTFEHCYKDIKDLVDHWERSTGLIRPATPKECADATEMEVPEKAHPPSGRKNKKNEKPDKKAAASDKTADKSLQKDSKEQMSASAADGEKGEGESADTTAPGIAEEKADKKMEEGVGLPNLMLDVASKERALWERILELNRLPALEEVLDGLGLGPRGPPIPPPAGFAVVPYPVKRHAPPGAEGGHYLFVASGPDDPNVVVDDKQTDGTEADEDKSSSPDQTKDENKTPTGSKGKGAKAEAKADATAKADGGKKGKKESTSSSKGAHGSARGGRPQRRGSNSNITPPPPGAATPQSEMDGSVMTADVSGNEAKAPKLNHFRWVIPAEGEVVIKLRFTSEDLGQFDQTLNFEIVGTRRRYQLYCRGVCAFPTISREPRIVFPNRKKSKKFDEIVEKKYILTSETFEFGPLLVGKSRDRYKEGRYPENQEVLTVLNTSPLDADINFCFLNDSKGDTFLLEPPTMLLKPGEKQELKIWAYPKTPALFEDAIVCCVKENPEPITFKISCHGVRPELELDKKTLQFDKVLLHRKDTKTLFLRNSTLLPVAWRLNGLENLGDDFSVSQESGVIEARGEFALHAYFRAVKAVTTSRRAIRLEVSDEANIMGTVQTETIQVHAEAYDVILDMTFPKGADGGIDFDVIRVFGEEKHTCSLKNKGRYDIQFHFHFEPSESCPEDVCSMFSVVPQAGTLTPNDKALPVQVTFKATKEVTVKDQPILRCKVIEPSLGDEGETIASIPIKLSVRSVFSKYNILPVNDINFGAMMVNSKKARTFTIENKGERFEFKYAIAKMIKAVTNENKAKLKGEKHSKSRDGSSSGSAIRPKKADSLSIEESKSPIPTTTSIQKMEKKRPHRQEPMGAGGGQTRLQLGAFTISPAMYTVPAGGTQIITVECTADSAGRFEEDIVIDITGRDPNDHPAGIPYHLIAEACTPAINVQDIGSIFEEHRICSNLSVWQHSNSLETGGVYGEDENRFVFMNTLVGSHARARFKISNPHKVPCDVLFSVKVNVTKATSKFSDVFEVEPARAQIPSHSHTYAVVTFIPPSMQGFSAQFEGAIDGLPQNQAKGRNLVFDLSGEGNLPRISILKPTVRNKKGQPLLLFRRNLVGRQESLPLHIVNDGTLPSKVDVDLIDPDSCFKLVPVGDTQAVMSMGSGEEGSEAGPRRPHTASVIINVGESASFDVVFSPKEAQRSQAQVRMSVVNNQYEDSVVQLVGEGYHDDITIDNIRNADVYVDPENEEGNMAEDDVAAAKSNHVKFGDCFINEPKTLTFTMTNHHKTDCVRFVWPDHPQLTFKPKVGHLHAGCTKELTVTFKSDKTVSLEDSEVPAKLCKITLDRPIGEVQDWDDRLRSVKWVDAVAPAKPSSASSTSGTKTPPAPAGPQPALKKVVETDPEPAYQEVPESTRNLDLLVSVNADFCKFKSRSETIAFRDTLMLQTRVFEFTLKNTGTISMDYNWQVLMDNFNVPGPRSVTFAPTEVNERPMTSGGALVVRDTSGRPTSAASSVASETAVAYVPFSIEPTMGSILPNKKQDFKVKFSPLDVSDYEGRLVCSIPNLEADKQGPVVGVKGRSLLPYCHFELEDSDYIRSARRNPELRGPRGAPAGTTLDPNTRVIEFTNVGVNVRNKRTFHIVNPTNNEYSFQWINEDEQNPKVAPNFVCVTPEGDIRSGKKAEIVFEFTSTSLELVESFWRFVIPEQNISVPFLLVGSTQDPNVCFDRSHFNFKALLIGHEATELVNLINNEDIPLHFSFEESSLQAPGLSALLNVSPMSGWLQPKSSIPVSVSFRPVSDKEVNFNLRCVLKKKTTPLTLNIKAEGYSMDCLVLCEDSTGAKVELGPANLNNIRFGEVEVNERSVRNVHIVNSGKFNFDYEWEISERTAGGDSMVSVSPMRGGVMYGQTERCQLAFCPPRQTVLRGCELKLKISNGPTYIMQIIGTGVLPGLHFSFLSHDFGPCFVHRGGMPPHTVNLRLTNTDKREISVECLYTPTAQLHHTFEAQVIPAAHTVEVPFTFYPREAIRYTETVTFEVNGLSKQHVTFQGHGTDLKIEVADPKHKLVRLGAMLVGQSVRKVIPIVNNSPAPITFKLGFTPSHTLLSDRDVFKFAPTSEISLPPRGGTAKIDLTFSPKQRIPEFSEELLMECAGMSQTLFVVSGCCQGIEIALDTDYIPFGAVVQRSSSVRKIFMSNSGDIGARFKWDIKKFAPDFSISPVEGYISQGMDVIFDATFHPQEINNDLRYDNLKCTIEGGKPLKLTLTGSCTTMPSVSREMLHVTTFVRHRETKNLMVANRTNIHWNLRPSVDGEYWSGADTFVVEPQSTKPYEVVYNPLAMTTEGKKHQGTVFFPLPDGQGLQYNLSGTAEAPKAVEKLYREVPCKTAYTELLTVGNWLKKPQRFKVRFEIIKPDKLDPGTSVKGLDYIDVPGNTSRDYKLTFYAHKEGQSQLKVVFQNEQTNEYLFYDVTFKSTKPGVIGVIELSTPVRQTVCHTVKIDNPLPFNVNFTVQSAFSELQCPSNQLVAANSTGYITLEYTPLKTGEVEGRLELNHNDLGQYIYDLKFKGTAPGPERAIYMRCPLGNNHIQTARFINFCKQKTEYSCSVDNKDFHVDKTVTAAPSSLSGTEVTIDVTYEPSRIGESRGILTVSSPQGGDYTFPLFGSCIPPKPQGPFIVKAGATTAITFRNVFPNPTQFMFQVDNPLFHITKPTDNIRARKDHRIQVGFDGNDSGSRAAVMGKLIVSCAKSAGGATNAQWVYYLKGVTPDDKAK